MFIVFSFSRPFMWRPTFFTWPRRGFSIGWGFVTLDLFLETWDEFLYAHFGAEAEEHAE